MNKEEIMETYISKLIAVLNKLYLDGVSDCFYVFLCHDLHPIYRYEFVESSIYIVIERTLQTSFLCLISASLSLRDGNREIPDRMEEAQRVCNSEIGKIAPSGYTHIIVSSSYFFFQWLFMLTWI